MENQANAFGRRERGMDSFKRSVRRGARRSKGDQPFVAVLKGVLLGACLTVISIAVLALLLNWWDASDRAITAINQVVKFAAILLGVTSAMQGGERGGVMRGACVGLLYMAFGIVCYCLLMGQSPRFTAYLADLGMGVAAGGLFGMILTARKNG